MALARAAAVKGVADSGQDLQRNFGFFFDKSFSSSDSFEIQYRFRVTKFSIKRMPSSIKVVDSSYISNKTKFLLKII